MIGAVQLVDDGASVAPGRERDMCDLCSEATLDQLAPSRRSAILLTTAALGTAFAGRAFAKDNKPPPKPQNVLSPDAALKRLMDGNARYVDGVTRRHDFRHEREALAGGQNPFAAVLSCADSRIAPEYAFDAGRGDLFVCRVAGNFAGTETIASMEYAVAVLNTPLILVLGHDACGAVDATLKAIKDNTPPPGHIPSLVDAIAPAAKAAMQQGGDVLDKAIRQNVIDNVAKLKSAAPILNAAADQSKLKIVGGIYRLTTGTVDLIAQG
jgi:carbonic anhydrase